MSLLETDPESGVYLGQDRPPQHEIPRPCEIDRIRENATNLQKLIGEKVKQILFELKRIFG